MKELMPKAGRTASVAAPPADIAQLKALMEYCRANGITKIKMNGIELELRPMGGEVSKEQREAVANALGADLSDEELLFFSAPQYVPVPRPAGDEE